MSKLSNTVGNDEASNRKLDASVVYKEGKYNVKRLSFPENVGSEEYPHYVLFFINTHSESKSVEGNKVMDIEVGGKNGITAQDAKNGFLTATTLAGANIGMALANKFMSGTNSSVPKDAQGADRFGGSIKGLAGWAAGAGIGNAVGQKLLNEQVKKVRLKDCIALAMQQAPTAKSKVYYDGVNIGGIIPNLNLNGVSDYTSLMDNIKRLGEVGLLTAASGLKSRIAGVEISDATASDLYQKYTGKALNPYKELLFQTVDFRQFQFQYRFIPTTPAESENVWNIIQTFKSHMYPELSKDKNFWLMPSEFQIMYCYSGKENNFFNKISTCVLVEADVAYGGQTFSTFDPTDYQKRFGAAPTEVVLTLKFVENEILDRKRIEKGY